jgi:hypothetical protein
MKPKTHSRKTSILSILNKTKDQSPENQRKYEQIITEAEEVGTKLDLDSNRPQGPEIEPPVLNTIELEAILLKKGQSDNRGDIMALGQNIADAVRKSRSENRKMTAKEGKTLLYN